MPTKYEVLVKTYDEVSALTLHEDEKAERALTAMAFLSLSGATIFGATLVDGGWHQLATPYAQLAYGFFTAFLTVAIAGTLITLVAVFPRFHARDAYEERGRRTDMPPESMLYAVEIAKRTEESWKDYWVNATPATVEADVTTSLAHEVHRMSVRVVTKIRRLRVGFNFFLVSLALLGPSAVCFALAVYH